MAYLLIDFRHVAYKAINLPKLQTMIEGQVADTTVATFAIKDIWWKSLRGQLYTAVCFEQGASGLPTFRKEYFQHYQNQGYDLTPNGYKGTRKKEGGAFYNAVAIAEHLVEQSGISCYRAERLEADDIIAILVRHIKDVLKDTESPIYILTNDADHLALVDSQVSVYMKSTRQHSEFGSPEYKGYYQVTPDTWTDFLEGTSEYGDYDLPFNSMLLYKMLKGDKSDEYKGAVTGYGKVTFNKLIYQMRLDGVDFENTFRYYKDFDREIAPVLSKYFEEDAVNRMAILYKGIHPITTLDGITPLHERIQKPLQISLGEVKLACSNLEINIS